MNTTRQPLWLATLLLGLGVGLFAVGGKLALVQLYGTDQPYADQWAAEGMYFLRGPLYYTLDWIQFTSLHGEHRPALTRLWVRGLILANEGQWDCYVELVANLLIYAAFLTAAWRWLAAPVVGRWRVAVAGCMAVVFALPCAYENFLWSFQSVFLFMLLLGLVHVYWTIGERRLGIRWVLAQVAGFLGLFSIAAGAMSAAALVVLAGLELVRGRRKSWAWSTLVINLILLGFGLWLLPVALLPTGTPLARLGQVATGLGYLLSWPFAGMSFSLLLQAPWIILLVRSWRKPESTGVAEDLTVGAVGLWVAGMAFAIAYGRAVNADTIGVRYYDVLVLGLFVNVVALARLVSRPGLGRRWLWRAGGFAWVAWLGVGLWQTNQPEDLAAMFKFQHGLAIEQRQVVRDFLVSDDPTKLQEFENTSHRFPHFKTTLDFLRDPLVPPLLPPSLTPDGHEKRLSRMARRVADRWPFLLGAGVVFLALGAAMTVGISPRKMRG